MPECHDDQFEKFHQMYEASSKEKRAAILWVLDNFELVDRITSIYTLSDTEIENQLQEKSTTAVDYILKYIFLFQKFKREHPEIDNPAE